MLQLFAFAVLAVVVCLVSWVVLGFVWFADVLVLIKGRNEEE